MKNKEAYFSILQLVNFRKVKNKAIFYIFFGLFFAFLLCGGAAAEIAAESGTNATKADAIICINNSYAIMDNLESNGFNIARVNDSIKTAEQAYAAQEKIEAREGKPDYSGVLKICSDIKTINDNAYLAKDKMFVLEKEYSDFFGRVKNFNINISDMEGEMDDLRREMADERYERVIEKIPQVRNELVQFEASATSFNLYYTTVTRGLKEFIIDNWIGIAVFFAIIIALIVFYRTRFRKYLIKRKIRNLETEKGIVLDMIQKSQRGYFEEQNMAEGEYSIKTKKFAELVRDIERQIPLLKEELAMMNKEKEFKLEDAIKEGRRKKR